MVLVTGATGLLGSYMCRLLLAGGEKVRAIRRKTSDLSLLEDVISQIEWYEADVLDVPAINEAMQGVEELYHCAAIVSHLPSEIDFMMKVNTEGVANVMNAALYAGVKKVVHVSSIAALGVAPDGRVIDENYTDPNINKCFWYYRSKHYGEREVWRAHAEGLNVVVVNPSTILGAGFWNTLPNSLFNEVFNGLSFYNASTNGFVDVRDVAECMHRLMKSSISGERYILSAENRSFKEVLWLMADALQVKRATIMAGKPLLQLAWMAEWLKCKFTGKKPVLTRESVAVAAVSFKYSNVKVCNALHFTFRPVEQTIKETAAAFLTSKKQNKGYGIF